jgi:DNA-directed RNA polymerase subunit omega
MRERLIHSIQKQVEIDEPEAAAAPTLPRDFRPTLGRDDPTTDAVVDTMTEEELLRGLERQTPDEPSSKSEGGPLGPRGY